MVFADILLDTNFFNYFLLPFLIFVSRIMDVSIGTLRIVMVSKGEKLWAPLLGFFEVLIWLLVITRIFENPNNWTWYIAYAAGFAAGNYIGLIIEERMAMGIVKIQFIVHRSATEMIQNLKNSGYGIVRHDAIGGREDVHIIYSIIKRNEIQKVENIVKATDPKAFYSIEAVKSVRHGIFPEKIVARRWRKEK
ncbi:MAG: DUF2179 domain-containing protein [Clostridia bacterium]|nr:DUF2179 domain-containing protein [Clostridia bacterium]